MPMRVDPPPADDEIECARCGAHFHHELTRCPKCGVAVYEPENDPEPVRTSRPPSLAFRLNWLVDWVDQIYHRITGKPYAVDELFGASINQAERFDSLLVKTVGDRAAAERLIDFERQQNPRGTRIAWIESAIQRWEHDNRAPGAR